MKPTIYIVLGVLSAWCMATIYFTSVNGDGWLPSVTFLMFNAVIFLTFFVRNGSSFRQPLPNSTGDRAVRIGVRILCGVIAMPIFFSLLGTATAMFDDFDLEALAVCLPMVLWGAFVTTLLVYFAVSGLRQNRIAPA